jgi:hypothetical protein
VLSSRIIYDVDLRLAAVVVIRSSKNHVLSTAVNEVDYVATLTSAKQSMLTNSCYLLKMCAYFHTEHFLTYETACQAPMQVVK